MANGNTTGITPQQQAIDGANEIAQLSQRFWQLLAQFTDCQARMTAQQWATYWELMPTAVLQNDGSVGTPDQTPQAANPIIVEGLNFMLPLANYTGFGSNFAAFKASPLYAQIAAQVAPFQRPGR